MQRIIMALEAVYDLSSNRRKAPVVLYGRARSCRIDDSREATRRHAIPARAIFLGDARLIAAALQGQLLEQRSRSRMEGRRWRVGPRHQLPHRLVHVVMRREPSLVECERLEPVGVLEQQPVGRDHEAKGQLVLGAAELELVRPPDAVRAVVGEQEEDGVLEGERAAHQHEGCTPPRRARGREGGGYHPGIISPAGASARAAAASRRAPRRATAAAA